MVNCACLFAALFFIISNALTISVIVQNVLNSDNFDFALAKVFDADYIQSRWFHRSEIAKLEQTAHIFNLLAWTCFLIPVLQLSWALSRGGKRKVGIHTAIASFAILGCISELLSRLLMYGTWGAANWIHKDFTLSGWVGVNYYDSVGWKTLELVYMVFNGMIMWVDAFEWICLFVIMILLYFSIGTQMPEHRTLSMGWGRLGLMIAFLCFIDLNAEILRLSDFQDFQRFAIFTKIVNTCLFLPLWLVWLSCTIRNAMPLTNDEDALL